MTQVYSNPSREEDPHALPDVEVFYVTQEDFDNCEHGTWLAQALENDTDATYAELAGWYWQARFPGCLPDGDPMGPYATEQEAIDAAQAEALFD